MLIPITGPIGPATSDFFVRALRDAGESGARLVVATIDTPGGLDTAMRDMIQAILADVEPIQPKQHAVLLPDMPVHHVGDGSEAVVWGGDDAVEPRPNGDGIR